MSLLKNVITKMREKGYQNEHLTIEQLMAMYGEVKILEEERDRRDASYYDAGLRQAAIKCIEWADTAGGGSGQGGEGYRNLANVLLAMQKYPDPNR